MVSTNERFAALVADVATINKIGANIPIRATLMTAKRRLFRRENILIKISNFAGIQVENTFPVSASLGRGKFPYKLTFGNVPNYKSYI